MNRKPRRLRRPNGFNLFEIMMVVGIIGIISAIMLPNFLHARQVSQGTICSSQLERIASAKVQAAFSEGLADTDTPTDEQVIQFMDVAAGTFESIDGSSDICPAGGTYFINDLNSNPTCSLQGGEFLEHRVAE